MAGNMREGAPGPSQDSLEWDDDGNDYMVIIPICDGTGDKPRFETLHESLAELRKRKPEPRRRAADTPSSGRLAGSIWVIVLAVIAYSIAYMIR